MCSDAKGNREALIAPLPLQRHRTCRAGSSTRSSTGSGETLESTVDVGMRGVAECAERGGDQA